MLGQVSDELRNTTIDAKIIRWINMGSIELATRYMFMTLHTYGNAIGLTGFADTTLAPDFLWLKSAQTPSNFIRLYPTDEAKLSQAYPDYRTRQGIIKEYYMSGSIGGGGTPQMGLWMVPSTDIEIEYSYQRKPLSLVDLNDISELPEEWHPLVCQKAITRGYSYDSNAPKSAESQAIEKKMLFDLGTRVNYRPDDTLIAGELHSTRNRPPYPKLPRHYPSVKYRR